jgi:ADP-ribosylglycohydrolase
MKRATGCLFGLAYGDALGAPTEFLDVPAIVARYGAGGPRELEGAPARVTDDTQMALAVAWALREAPEATPAALEPLLRRRFIDWSVSPDNDRAPGNTCLAACAALATGAEWQQAAVMGSKGCGANMRVAPVGLVPGYDMDTLGGVAQLQAGMTHGHPTALAASELTALAVRLARDGGDLAALPAQLRAHAQTQRHTYRTDWLGDLWQNPLSGLRPGLRDAADVQRATPGARPSSSAAPQAGATPRTSPEEFIARGWDECLAVLDRLDAALAAPDDGGDPCLATGAGWIAEEALATALLCALRHPDDPVAALDRAATTSGDSDSIACLAGAVLGAARGADAWPPAWSDRIEYADQLAALGTAWD